jgi:hypothetical protein
VAEENSEHFHQWRLYIVVWSVLRMN